MKIGILGVGYVGSRTSEALRSLGHEIILFSRKSKPGFLIWPAPIQNDIDVMVFCAAPDSSEQYRETYLLNAERLINSPAGKIVYTSSTSVYGEHAGKIVTEETPLHALNPKTQILIDTENTLLNRPNTLIFRLGEIVGPGREIQQRLVSRPVLAGTGENRVNLSPIEDIVSAIIFGIEKDLRGIYNLVNDFHPTRKELYESLVPGLKWDPNLLAPHGGNKIVSSQKYLFECRKKFSIRSI